MKVACEILVRKPNGKRPLHTPRCRWEDDIKVDLKIGCEGVDWIQALVNMVMNFCFHKRRRIY